MSNVISLAERTNDAAYETPLNLLESVVSEIKAEPAGVLANVRKLVIVALDDREEGYSLRILNAGMKHSEIIALAEVLKTEMLKNMNYIPES